MKKLICFITLFILVITATISLARKPYSEWMKEDVIEYFESNNIIFEGEFRNPEKKQEVLIGRLNSSSELINMNFFLNDGRLVKALLTTTQNNTFNTLQDMILDQGFEKVSESNDQLGNQYAKYQSGTLELTLVNRNADWPEVYFQP